MTEQEITDLARRLGQAIAEAPQTRRMNDLREQIQADAELSKLLDDYQAQSEKIADLEDKNKPIEVDDKRRCQELHDKLIANPTFKKYTAAQVEYVDLMRKVNDAMDAPLRGEPSM